MVRVKPVARLISLTCAPVTAAPDGSRTTPAMVPVGACARAQQAATNVSRKNIVRSLFIAFSFCLAGPHRTKAGGRDAH